MCNKNASYTSKTTQNDLLGCIKDYIQEQIVFDVKSQEVWPFYGIMADEVTDTSNWEQLGLVLCYVKNGHPEERFLEFVMCENITGEAIPAKLSVL